MSLKNYRTSRGWTVLRMANFVGTSKQSLIDMEEGTISTPDYIMDKIDPPPSKPTMTPAELKVYRVGLGMSLKDIAKIHNVAPHTWSLMEKGLRPIPFQKEDKPK